VWPTGQSQPLVSTLNDLPGTIVANAAIVPAGTSGSINVYASNNTDLIIDINGYYAASFGTPIGGYQFPNTSGTPLMTITPTGAVGIGTTTPGYPLDVTGDINFTGIIRYAGAPEIQFINGDNVAVGRYALYAPTGTGNTALGDNALYANTTGSDNTGIGTGALGANTTGYRNTATSSSALGSNNTGHDNTATGVNALSNNTTGATNTAIGSMALLNNVSGGNNIAIGDHAAFNVYLATNNNIHIGTRGSSSDSSTIRIGGFTGLGDPASQSSFFAAGVRGTTTANNDAVPVVIDSAGQLGTVSSSRRFKEDIQDMADSSSGLMRLRPVTFRYQKPFADGTKPVQYGLIAEEVAEVYPDLVVHSADGQIETVKYQVLDSMLLNEVQRQQKEIVTLKDENQSLRKRLERLEAAMASASGAGVQ
jgi:hypothetical protein